MPAWREQCLVRLVVALFEHPSDVAIWLTLYFARATYSSDVLVEVFMHARSLKELSIFCEVVEKSSFIVAARTFGLSPSSISRAVKILENRIGAILLNRSRMGVGPTNAGEIYYEYAKKIVEFHTNAEAEIASLHTDTKGWIRFSAPTLLSNFYLPQRLAKVSASFPDIQFDIMFTDALVNPITENLDFSIRGAFPVSSELIMYPLWNYELILCASSRYVEKYGLPKEPAELESHSIVALNSLRAFKDWYFRSPSSRKSIRVRVNATHRSDNSLALYQLVAAGHGIGRVSSWIAHSHIRAGLLVRVCPAYRVVSSSGHNPLMHAVYGSKGLPHRNRILLEMLKLKHPNSFEH